MACVAVFEPELVEQGQHLGHRLRRRHVFDGIGDAMQVAHEIRVVAQMLPPQAGLQRVQAVGAEQRLFVLEMSLAGAYDLGQGLDQAAGAAWIVVPTAEIGRAHV